MISQELTASDSERYEHSTKVEYIHALAYPENMAPMYPPELLARRLLPMAVLLRLVVGANGAEARVESLDPPTTSEHDHLFEAVPQAGLLWKFSPLIRLDRDAGPTVATDVGGTTTFRGRPTALPFHRDHASNFRQHDGQPQIEVTIAKPSK